MFLKSELFQGTNKTQYLGNPCASWGYSCISERVSELLVIQTTEKLPGIVNLQEMYIMIQPTPGSNKTLLTTEQISGPTALPLGLRKRLPFLSLSWSFPINTCPVPLSTLNWAQKESWKISKQRVARTNFLPASLGSYLLSVHLLNIFPK